MKIQYAAMFALLMACALYACKHPQKNKGSQQTPAVQPQSHTAAVQTATLSFGSVGGFTGATVKYIVSPSGNVTRIRTKNPADTTTLKPLSDKELEQIFTNAANLQLSQLTLNQPGNMSYFIEYANKNQSNTLIWGDYKKPTPPNVANYYEQVMLMLRAKE